MSILHGGTASRLRELLADDTLTDASHHDTYADHKSYAERTAVQLGLAEADGQDALQEAIASVQRKLRDGAVIDNADAYLTRTVRNNVLARKKGVLRATPHPEEDLTAVAGAVSDASAAPEEAMLVREVLAEMPTRQRQALVMVDAYGYKPADVARRWGAAPASVSAVLYRARRTFRRSYIRAHLIPTDRAECRTERQRMLALVDRGRSPRTVHTRSCEPCAAQALDLVAAARTVRSYIPVAVSPLLWLVHGSSKGGKSVSTLRGRRPLRSFLAAASTVVAAAVVVSGGASAGVDDPVVARSGPQPVRVSTPTDDAASTGRAQGDSQPAPSKEAADPSTETSSTPSTPGVASLTVPPAATGGRTSGPGDAVDDQPRDHSPAAEDGSPGAVEPTDPRPDVPPATGEEDPDPEPEPTPEEPTDPDPGPEPEEPTDPAAPEPEPEEPTDPDPGDDPKPHLNVSWTPLLTLTDGTGTIKASVSAVENVEGVTVTATATPGLTLTFDCGAVTTRDDGCAAATMSPGNGFSAHITVTATDTPVPADATVTLTFSYTGVAEPLVVQVPVITGGLGLYSDGDATGTL